MKTQQKLKVITGFEKLNDSLKRRLKDAYPYGYQQDLISFMNRDGDYERGLRLETEEKIYLIRMSKFQVENFEDEDSGFYIDEKLAEETKKEFDLNQFDANTSDG